MEGSIKIEKMRSDDWEAVRAIYLAGIATGHATFQKEAPSWEGWDSGHDAECRIVARTEEEVVGWAALSPVSSRSVYAGVGEVSVYVSQKHNGKRIGSLLLKSLIDLSEQNGFWTLQSSIFPENAGSIKLHKNFGFREMGRRERIGKMDGVWRDTVILERRSRVVGNH
ncbi:GNAT family N-acetyltransferase [Bacillus sp. ISL-37]|jgi:L-amino acid N-acyltransferase YncA|uniref:GNAT family N-acetyltransferase n=1 Tax=Bacillus sp. ISL-37 TaxID=2819123 RepID=UPI001BE5E3A5|nr:GNAT family N-acetyltransferase [Bacillus sp. ISL-37]MBT2684697.1 N-acetyltransferase [Bacillus sp. ISL-37]